MVLEVDHVIKSLLKFFVLIGFSAEVGLIDWTGEFGIDGWHVVIGVWLVVAELSRGLIDSGEGG
jgi:hypothetical protein